MGTDLYTDMCYIKYAKTRRMENSAHIVVIGAGIVGVSAGIWLRRKGFEVTLVDKDAPGEGTTSGNAGVLAACSVAPVTAPGMIAKSPGLLLDPNFPLFLRWSYLHKLTPWLVKYLSNANDADTRRIAAGLAPLTTDAVAQHSALIASTDAASWLQKSDYSFAYAARANFEADAYTWGLRRDAGFVPELVEGPEVREREPLLADEIGLLAVMRDHGYLRDPKEYVKALARVFEAEGGVYRQCAVKDLSLSNGHVTAVQTDKGALPCDSVVLAAGVWSKPLADKLGLKVPMETERGYHIVFKNPSETLNGPVMVAAGKFVATPMADGLRCAGIVEFGGLQAGPSTKPLALLEKVARATFPTLEFRGIDTWLGHRPAPSDSLPLIGEIGSTGVVAAFGHHHIGLTSGPKTGRLVADIVARTGGSNLDLTAYSPNRFN